VAHRVKLRVLLVAVSLVCASFTVAACGPFGGDSPEDALEDFKDAAADRDEEKMCELFTDRAKRELEENFEPCEKFFAEFSNENLDTLAEFEVKDVEEDGDEATATVESDGEEDELQMKKEDGDWKIDEGATAN
jgi:hypothetical protein